VSAGAQRLHQAQATVGAAAGGVDRAQLRPQRRLLSGRLWRCRQSWKPLTDTTNKRHHSRSG